MLLPVLDSVLVCVLCGLLDQGLVQGLDLRGEELTDPGGRERFASVGIVLPVDPVVTLAVDELLVNYILDGEDVVLTGIMARLWSLRSRSTLGRGLATGAHTCCCCLLFGCLGATCIVFVVTDAAVGGGCLWLGASHRRLVKSAAAQAKDPGPSRYRGSM